MFYRVATGSEGLVLSTGASFTHAMLHNITTVCNSLLHTQEQNKDALYEEAKAGYSKEKFEDNLKRSFRVGMEKGTEKVARNLIHQGVKLEMISKVTGLPEESIKALG